MDVLLVVILYAIASGIAVYWFKSNDAEKFLKENKTEYVTEQESLSLSDVFVNLGDSFYIMNIRFERIKKINNEYVFYNNVYADPSGKYLFSQMSTTGHNMYLISPSIHITQDDFLKGIQAENTEDNRPDPPSNSPMLAQKVA